MTTAALSTVEIKARDAARLAPWPVFWVASIAAFIVSLDATMLYAAFGALRAGFPEASAADLSWVLNAYTVVYAAALIPAGGLAQNLHFRASSAPLARYHLAEPVDRRLLVAR